MQIDVTLFELCAAWQNIGRQFRFEAVQSVYVVREENDEL